jgi:hypothetical protein
MGIVSTGTDSLMSTTVQPGLAGVGVGGAGVPGQQTGATSRLPGPQAESGNQDRDQDRQQRRRNSAGSVLGSTFMACMAGVLGLLMPALL